jgi:hypothetical protein
VAGLFTNQIKMERLKKIIFEVLVRNQETCKIGSDGDYSQEQCVFAWDFDLVSEEIAKIVSDNFEHKKCMPDGINSKEEHEEYLKAIGYEKYVKDLQHHKDTTVGLYSFDKELDNIFENIPNKEGCKTSVEAYLVQQIEYLKSIVFRIS